VPAEHLARVVALGREIGVPLYQAGAVGTSDDPFTITLRDGAVSFPVPRLREVYFGSLPRRMGD